METQYFWRHEYQARSRTVHTFVASDSTDNSDNEDNSENQQPGYDLREHAAITDNSDNEDNSEDQQPGYDLREHAAITITYIFICTDNAMLITVIVFTT